MCAIPASCTRAYEKYVLGHPCAVRSTYYPRHPTSLELWKGKCIKFQCMHPHCSEMYCRYIIIIIMSSLTFSATHNLNNKPSTLFKWSWKWHIIWIPTWTSLTWFILEYWRSCKWTFRVQTTSGTYYFRCYKNKGMHSCRQVPKVSSFDSRKF